MLLLVYPLHCTFLCPLNLLVSPGQTEAYNVLIINNVVFSLSLIVYVRPSLSTVCPVLKVTKCILYHYVSTVLKVFLLNILINTTLYLYSTCFLCEILHFLLKYIYLTAIC